MPTFCMIIQLFQQHNIMISFNRQVPRQYSEVTQHRTRLKIGCDVTTAHVHWTMQYSTRVKYKSAGNGQVCIIIILSAYKQCDLFDSKTFYIILELNIQAI